MLWSRVFSLLCRVHERKHVPKAFAFAFLKLESELLELSVWLCWFILLEFCCASMWAIQDCVLFNEVLFILSSSLAIGVIYTK